MPFLKVVADECLTNDDNRHHCLMHVLIKAVLDFNRLTYSTGVFYTTAELEALTETAQRIGSFMQLLRSEFKEEKTALLFH